MNKSYLLAITIYFFTMPMLYAQKIVEDIDGIWQESFDSTKSIPPSDIVNRDNKTYVPKQVFLYDFNYVKGKDTFKVKFLPVQLDLSDLGKYKKEKDNAWLFIPLDSVDKETITNVRATIQNGNCNEGQTPILYEYIKQNGITSATKETTGVIENRKNIWLHPPRDRFFKITEINPFPFIKTPYKVGNKWTWTLEIGGFWGNSRWKEWAGSIINKYTYEITAKKTLNTKLGILECLEIKSMAESRIGKTYATFYFNKKYGFIKWVYTNIDGSQLLFDIKAIN